MNTRRRVDRSIVSGLLLVALTMLAIAMPVKALPMQQPDFAPCPSRFIGTSPLAGPEFYVARARCEEVGSTAVAAAAPSPLDGPEFYVERARSGEVSSIGDRIGTASPLHGPEFYVERVRSGEVSSMVDKIGAPSPLHGPEFYATRVDVAPRMCICASWADAVARSERVKSLDDPVDGAKSLAEAEFYVAKHSADLVACTIWLEAVLGFDRPRPVEDPVLGAQSPAEAAFLVARYGAGGTGMAIIEGDILASLCDADTG